MRDTPVPRLSAHVFMCVADHHPVLLDLRSDRYLCLPPETTPVARALMEGRPAGPEGAPLLLEMREEGLIDLTGAEGCPRQPPPVAGRDLNTLDMPLASPTGILTALRFLQAVVTAYCLLSLFGLERTVRWRRGRRQPSERRPEETSPRLRVLVNRFERLRPFVFTARDRCLFDSLALHLFLAAHGEASTWIFAVRTQPFIAQCWIQQGDCVCNDTIDHVRLFTPIMAV